MITNLQSIDPERLCLEDGTGYGGYELPWKGKIENTSCVDLGLRGNGNRNQLRIRKGDVVKGGNYFLLSTLFLCCFFLLF